MARSYGSRSIAIGWFLLVSSPIIMVFAFAIRDTRGCCGRSYLTTTDGPADVIA